MQDSPTPNKSKLPPFWFLLLLCLLVIVPLTYWILTIFDVSRYGGAHHSVMWESVLTSAWWAAIPYAIHRFSKHTPSEQQKREQERLRTLRNPPKFDGKLFLGIICAVVGVVSCVAHLIVGRPSVPQVIGFTVGTPLYAYLAFRLIVTIAKAIERRESRRDATASARNTAHIAVPVDGSGSEVQTTQTTVVLPAPVHAASVQTLREMRQ